MELLGDIGGFLGGGSGAESSSKYQVTAPKAMPSTKKWQALMDEFLLDYTGQTGTNRKREIQAQNKYVAQRNRLLSLERDLELAKLRGKDTTALERRVAEQRVIVDGHKKLYEALSGSPVKDAYTEGLAEQKGAYRDIADYQRAQAGLVPGAMGEANVGYQDALSQIISRGLSGEGLGFDTNQMNTLLSALTNPPGGQSVGFDDQVFNFLPRGAYDTQVAVAGAIPEIMGQRGNQMALLNQLAQGGMTANVLPALAQYQYGQDPLNTLLESAQTAPAGSDVLNALASNPAMMHEMLRYLGGAGIATGSGEASGSSQGGVASFLSGFGDAAEGLGGGQGIGSLLAMLGG